MTRPSAPRPTARAAGARARRRATVEGLEDRTLFALDITAAGGTPAIDLANRILLGTTGITVTGATYIGGPNQGGLYSGFSLISGATRLAIADGVILTSGSAVGALGPNINVPDDPTGVNDQTANAGTPGDADLDVLVDESGSDISTLDANGLSITFTADSTVNSILFDFIFGSEEFPDFVGTFNDAFGAYLDGTQISFDTDGNAITVNNNFFSLNNSGLTDFDDPDVTGTTGVTFDIEYDGLTPVIRTQAPLNTGLSTHTLKLVIADADGGAGDTILDSGVFISRFQGSPQVVSGPTTDLPQSGVFNFSQGDYLVSEAGLFATITVLRDGGSSGLATVDVLTSDGTAIAGSDFTALGLATLTFAAGQTSQTVSVQISNDTIAEGDENFTIILANPTNGATLGESDRANVQIGDDELGVQFSQSTYTISEGTSTVTATITVVLTSAPSGDVTVDFATIAGGSATPDVDYMPVTGTLTFAAGTTTQTFTISIFDDYVVEGADDDSDPTTTTIETINLSLSNPSSPIIIGLVNPAVLEIEDLNRPPAVIDAQFVSNERFLNGIALRYSEAMTETFAEDLKNYDIFLRKESKRLGGSATRTRMEIVAAVYEPTSRTVTLTTRKALKENKIYEVIVNTTRADGVESIFGEALDGNFDNNAGDDFTGYLSRASRISYFDRHGDRVNLQLTKGPGRMELFRNVERDARQIRMIDTSQDTILTGTVDPQIPSLSDNRADIRNLLTGNGFRNRLPQPPFNIDKTINGFQVPNT